MSLELLLNIICDLAIKRNLVNYAAAGPSIYGLNADTIKDYPFIFASPTSNVVTRKNFTDYTLTLFYVDRLLADLTNETHIFSIANDTLVNLLRQLKQLDGIVDISEPTVRLFTETERMSDRCAGGYTEVTITVLNDAECPVIFDETGEPIGTYIPNTLKDLNILDSLASKTWVVQYVADHAASGGTDEKEVRKLINQSLTAYTRTADFATINGSGITSGETYNLVEKSDFETFYSSYTGDLASVYAAISAATPEDYGALRTQVSANTGNISTISGATVGNIENITELSAFTSGLSFTVNEHTENIEQISALTQTLSGDTSDLRAFLGDLSASTSSAVSSTTQEIETLTGAVSALSAGKQDALTAGENITIENNVISAAGNVRSTSVYTIWSGSQAAYSALGTYDNNTLYVITDANT